MKQKFAGTIALLAWAAVVIQFFLLMKNRTAGPTETIIRFFSYFTILTNAIVAVSFSVLATGRRAIRVLTPVTVYIFIVGLVYQVLLRHTWSPTGLQMVVDELLHTIIPLLVLVYWWFYDDTRVHYAQIPKWMLYPLLYLVFILSRGAVAGYYPYPFVNVAVLGLKQVLVNAALLLLVFLLVCILFVWLRARKGEVEQ